MGSELKNPHKISRVTYQHFHGVKNIIYVTVAF